MGIRRKKKDVELPVEHMSTNLFISICEVCSKCPCRIYADEDDKIILGVGNIYTDTVVILPSYDVKAGIGYPTILKIMQDAYKDIVGKELLEDCYVTRTIKCFNKTDFNLEKDAVKSCFTNLIYEVSRIKPKKVIILDKQIYDFGLYSCNRGKFAVKTVISPGVMYYDNQNLKDIFMKQLTEAINDS
jgi:hypothetical protein